MNSDRGYNMERKLVNPVAPQVTRRTADTATETVWFMMVVSGWSIPCSCMLGIAARVFLWLSGFDCFLTE